ncbi:MAG TPA: sulfate ABC transporter ATP-binding protein [Kiritimatiellia bacterium]|nr:sulfate ABC transporter ATP-binding protein [Kiritimatiellia bacterium]
MSIEVQHITKRFGAFTALNDVSVKFPTGQLVGLLGPSGSGKTTLLRIIAGLERADTGRVLFGGEDATQHSARDRRVGFVFQHYALFRHMTVFDNVAFGLRVKPRAHRPSREEIRERVMKLLGLVQLDWLADRLPSQLSGGQRQRVALARALAVEPKVLLLDEPFGALDAKVRKELRRWLRRLHDEIHVTSIFVTHDVEEALEVSDQVVVMNNASVEQIGTPDAVYETPASPFVYDFLGSTNVFHRQADPDRPLALFTANRADAKPDDLIFARPHDIEISRHLEGGASVRGRVMNLHTIGPIVRVEVEDIATNHLVEVELAKAQFRQLNLAVNDLVYVRPRNPRIFEPEYAI